MSKELRICPGVGARKCGAFLARLDRDPHPTCTRCRGSICTRDMTCDFCAVWSAEQWALFGKKRTYKERKHRPSGSAPPAQQTSPRAETSSGVSRPGTSSASSSRPLGGQGKTGGSQGAPGVVSGGAPSPPARPRSSERGGSASRRLSGVGGLASSSPSPSGGGGVEVARSRQTSLSRVSESVDSPSFSPHVPRRENVRESSGSCSRAVSSRDSRSSVREPRKDRRARSREGSSRGRRRLSLSRSSSRSRSRGRERARRSSSASRSSRGRSRRERSRSSDRYRSRRGSSRSRRDRSRSSDRYRSRRERSRSVDRARSRRERARSPARRGERRDRSRSHASPSRSVDRSRSIERLPASSSRLREDGAGRLARRGIQEGVEAVASQPAVVPGVSADVTPVAGGTSMTALPSAMKELARFFLNLSGSSSLGASGDFAGVTASGAALGDLAGPSSSASGAATFCGTAAPPAGAGVLPDASDALPSVSGERRHRVRSRSRDRRSRSSSDGTDRRAKKRSKRGSPSPERSSRRREKRYRSSSDSSEDVRAAASSPRARRAHGGARAGGSTWDYGRPRSYARVDLSQSGTHRRSPGPSGVAEDDRSTTFESVDFARDDSFRAVLGLIREFHDMAEPATVPGARCKTSLASAYGLAADSYPSFSLPLSPLLSTLLMDINSDLSKFMEDQTVHGFLPVPGRRQRRYYGTSPSSFPGPYTAPPGLTSITMEKASEVRKRSVSLSASQVSSLETMLSGMCEVSSWLDWWLSTCGGFRDLLPLESRADFERLMMSGSRSLEFLASQGCTALGNLVLSRRDALLADVRGTVPVEEVARLRYSPLPLSAAIFPHTLLDSALLKMRAAASDALVQRTLHPPRVVGLRLLGRVRPAPLVLLRPRSSRLLPLLPVSLARGRRRARVRLPFPLPLEAPAAREVKEKGPGRSQPDGVTLPMRVGGCLSSHWRRWQEIGAETWVVTVLRDGYRVPFKDSPPPLARTPVSFPTYRAGSPRAQALRQEVEAMLAKGALEIARDPGPGFYSRLFLVEKATGGWRPVIDLSHLNDFVQLTPFKMETVASVLLSVREGDFLASLDLKDAYFQIPIHGSSRKLLRFMSEGTVYQFKALCFGLSTAPQVFTRVFAAVSAWAHARGIRLLRYLDDWLVLSSSEKKAKESIRELLSLCRTLGIVINEKKSDLVPSQSAKYLGMTIDTGAGKVFPSLARVEKFLADPTAPLPGRLVGPLLLGEEGQGVDQGAPLALSHPRDCDKREEVGSRALAVCEVSRYDHRYRCRQGLPVSSKSREVPCGSGEILFNAISPSSALAGDLGSPGFAGAVGSSRSTSDALLAVASEDVLVPRVRPSLASGGFAGGSETGPVLVDGEGSPVSGGSIRDTCSGSTPVFGRVFVGLGCSPPRSKRVRGVVRPEVVAHQSSRNEGPFPGSSGFSRRCSRSPCDRDVRQLHGCGVRQQTGGHGVEASVFVDQPPSEMDGVFRRPSRSEVSSRRVQRPGRCTQPSRASCGDRVVSPPSGGESTSSYVGQSVDRPVRDLPQREAAPILLACPESTGRLRGCVSSSLGRPGSLRVSLPLLWSVV